ncbi:hypothetical protein C8R46DRAFT_1357681 [Mycena filopes]|nr:hypothetical protein C8R46DRAFT_1357681 [Mycena filopes]
MNSVRFILPSSSRMFSIDSDTTLVDMPDVSPPRLAGTSSRAGPSRRSIPSEYTTTTQTATPHPLQRAAPIMIPQRHHPRPTLSPRRKPPPSLRAHAGGVISPALDPLPTPDRPNPAVSTPPAATFPLAHFNARRVSSLSLALQGLIIPSNSLALPPRNGAPAAHTNDSDEATAMRRMLAALVAAKNTEAEEEARLRAVLGGGVVGGRSKFARVRVRRNGVPSVNGVRGEGAGWMCGFEVRAAA